MLKDLLQEQKKEFKKEFGSIHENTPMPSGLLTEQKITDFLTTAITKGYELALEEVEEAKLVSNIALMKLLVERGTKGDMERLIEEFTERLAHLKETNK